MIDASDPGKAAIVNLAAAVLFAEISGMNAENQQRQANGYSMAYTHNNYSGVIDEVLVRFGLCEDTEEPE